MSHGASSQLWSPVVGLGNIHCRAYWWWEPAVFFRACAVTAVDCSSVPVPEVCVLHSLPRRTRSTLRHAEPPIERPSGGIALFNVLAAEGVLTPMNDLVTMEMRHHDAAVRWRGTQSVPRRLKTCRSSCFSRLHRRGACSTRVYRGQGARCTLQESAQTTCTALSTMHAVHHRCGRCWTRRGSAMVREQPSDVDTLRLCG